MLQHVTFAAMGETQKINEVYRREYIQFMADTLDGEHLEGDTPRTLST